MLLLVVSSLARDTFPIFIRIATNASFNEVAEGTRPSFYALVFVQDVSL